MPSTVIISRFAEEDSILGSLELAKVLAAAGSDVHLVFTHEALHALHRGTMGWSASFKDRGSRATVIKKARDRGLDLADASRDPRWSDVRALVRAFAETPQVTLVACPVWREYLDIGDELPHLTRPTPKEYAVLLQTSTVIGGY